MKRIIMTSILVLFIIGFMVGTIMIKNVAIKDIEEKAQEEEITVNNAENEYVEINNELIEETTAEEETISPNCTIILRRYYTDCGHTIEENSTVTEELVNMTEDELQERYYGWQIEKFTSNEVILYRELNSECGEHYILRDVNGKVVVYLNDNDTEEIILETEIYTEYLPEVDRIELKNGLEVIGEMELNKILEDFE